MTGEFTVGQWALGVVQRYYRTPRQVLDAHGRWRPNPAHLAASRAAVEARATVAHHLGIPLDQLGPCAGCQVPHHRYDDDGRPLCPACQAALERRRAEVEAARQAERLGRAA